MNTGFAGFLMDNKELAMKARKVIDKLARSEIEAYRGASLDPPDPFRGSGEIRLIVVGQNPTVQDPTVSPPPGFNA